MYCLGMESRIKPLELSSAEKERFWTFVDKKENKEDCWLWKRAISAKGYGVHHLRRNGKWSAFRAARIALVSSVGFDICPFLACHRCDNPSCCNPDHLYAGTEQSNMDDMWERNRGASGEKSGFLKYPEKYTQKGDGHWMRQRPQDIISGENHKMTKISDAEVVKIRELHKSGVSSTVLANQFSLSRNQIWRIVTRRCHRFI